MGCKLDRRPSARPSRRPSSSPHAGMQSAISIATWRPRLECRTRFQSEPRPRFECRTRFGLFWGTPIPPNSLFLGGGDFAVLRRKAPRARGAPGSSSWPFCVRVAYGPAAYWRLWPLPPEGRRGRPLGSPGDGRTAVFNEEPGDLRNPWVANLIVARRPSSVVWCAPGSDT